MTDGTSSPATSKSSRDGRQGFAPDGRHDGGVVVPTNSLGRETDAMRAAHGLARPPDDVAVEASRRGCALSERGASVVRDREELEQAGRDPGRAAWIADDCNADAFRHKGGKYATGVGTQKSHASA